MLAFDTALAQHLSVIDSHGKERMVQLRHYSCLP